MTKKLWAAAALILCLLPAAAVAQTAGPSMTVTEVLNVLGTAVTLTPTGVAVLLGWVVKKMYDKNEAMQNKLTEMQVSQAALNEKTIASLDKLGAAFLALQNSLKG